jgi:hypothetical protein
MNKKATLNIQENREIGQILNATFVFIGITFKALFRDILIIAGPFYVLAGIFSSLSTYNSLRLISTFGTSGGAFSQFQVLSPAYWLDLLCLLIGFSLSTCIIANHVLMYKTNGPEYNKEEARRYIRGDIMRVTLANFLNVLVVIVATIFFIIPGIYLIVANSLITTIIVLDKQTGTMDAFGESRRLIRDNWWAALGLGLIVGIITLCVQLIFKIPSSILTTVITFNTLRNGEDIGSYKTLFIVFNAIAYLGTALVSPISVVASSIFYYSLKEKKDHTSLMQNIESIGVQPARTETDIQKDEGDF